MENLNELQPLKSLQNIINKMGWYTGKSQLRILYEGQFEGYSGRASEDWEQQASIELIEKKRFDGTIICPYIKVVGAQYESIEDVAKKVIRLYNKWVLENN